MPSSMIFVSLVVLWLLILVPAVARHRQEVARPSVAALSGRVLARSPRRQNQEVDGMGERDGADVTVDRAREAPVARAERRREDEAEHGRESPDEPAVDDVHGASSVRGDGRHDDGYDSHDDGYDDRYDDSDDPADHDDRVGERTPARYRAGRGGFDAEAAALAARARYTFRQRVVLVMLVAALVTGITAGVAVPGLWWPHAAIDILLVGYLAYLRRQVRLEETIRARRAARMAGTRRRAAADDPDLDEWAERGRSATRSHPAEEADEPSRWSADDDSEDRSAVAAGEAGTAEGRVPPEPPSPADEDDRPALPRLHASPLPPPPAGTAIVEDDDAELDVDEGAAPGYRRAVGQ